MKTAVALAEVAAKQVFGLLDLRDKYLTMGHCGGISP